MEGVWEQGHRQLTATVMDISALLFPVRLLSCNHG